MEVNKISAAKKCNVCHALLFDSSEGIERCSQCVSVHGQSGVPIILTQAQNAQNSAISSVVKKMESIEYQRKRELLNDPEYRIGYETQLEELIAKIYNVDKVSVAMMDFEDREVMSKEIFEAIKRLEKRFVFYWVLFALATSGLSFIIFDSPHICVLALIMFAIGLVSVVLLTLGISEIITGSPDLFSRSTKMYFALFFLPKVDSKGKSFIENYKDLH